MNLKDYQQSALRTESRVENVSTNMQAVSQLLAIIVSAGQMLDQIKKNVFYSKPLNKTQFDKHVEDIKGATYYFRHIEHMKHPLDVSDDTTVEPRLFHAIIGMVTECAELVEEYKKVIEGGTVDKIKFQDESTDLNWYQAIMNDTLTINWETGLDRNIAKLKARFPDKFTNDNAINRDIDSERKALEGGDPKLINCS